MSDGDTVTSRAPHRAGANPAVPHVILASEPWSRILTPSFIRRHTPFLSLGDLIAHCGSLSAEEGSRRVECEMVDDLIRQQTRFDGLTDFLRAALHEWVSQEPPV